MTVGVVLAGSSSEVSMHHTSRFLEDHVVGDDC